MLTAGVILLLTYIGIAFTRLPKINVDRPMAAFLGGIAMVAFGVLSPEQAASAIDFNTIALLVGMMLLVSVLQRQGFFTVMAHRALSVGRTPRRLLIVITVTTAVASAFLVNDAVVLLFTPVVIRACHLMRVNPIPYLLTEAMASNIGSTATIVGNPQNMLIGIASGIPFARFFAYLLPVAVLSTVVLIVIVYVFYRRDLRADAAKQAPAIADAAIGLVSERYTSRQLRWSLVVVAGAVVLFFTSSLLGLKVPLIALVAGAVAILIARSKPSSVFRGVDWVLLVFFAGLFVVIGGARQSGLLNALLSQEQMLFTPDVSGIISLSVFSATISQLVSNVPLTMLVIPLIKDIQGDTLWVTLAASSTLGGNATLIGAVANIIVAEVAARDGVEVRFGEFLRVGLPVTAATLALAVGVLVVEFQMGWLR